MKIFFDVDGVLIDGWHVDPALRKPWDADLKEDLGIDRAALEQALFSPPPDGSDAPMLTCIKGCLDLKEALAPILRALGYHEPVDRFLAYWFEKDSKINTAVLDVVDLLKKKENVNLYIATGQEHRRAAYLWHDLGFSKRFEEMFYSADLGLAKDSAAFFREINRRLAISSDEHPLFFDDRQNVVDAAREAGWDAHVFRHATDLTDNSRIAALLKSR